MNPARLQFLHDGRRFLRAAEGTRLAASLWKRFFVLMEAADKTSRSSSRTISLIREADVLFL